MLTIEWQPLSTRLGYEVPDLVSEAGLEQEYVGSLERSRELYEALRDRFTDQASYAGARSKYQLRYVIQMNAREAMHLIELRSGPQGHPAYRRIAQEMHRAIVAKRRRATPRPRRRDAVRGLLRGRSGAPRSRAAK